MTAAVIPFPILAELNTQSLVLAALGLALIVWVVAVQVRRRQTTDSTGSNPERSATLSPHEELERMSQERGVRGDLRDLMREIENLTSRLDQQMETRSAKLEQLIREADERIAELRRLQSAVEKEPKFAETPPLARAVSAVASSQGGSPSSLPDDPLARSVYDLADQGYNPSEIAKRLDEHVGKIELILALREA